MTFTKNSQEAKDLMQKVREAKAKKTTIPTQEGEALPKDTKPSETNEKPLIDLPHNKFQLLLNLIMSIQDDIDYLMSKLH